MMKPRDNHIFEYLILPCMKMSLPVMIISYSLLQDHNHLIFFQDIKPMNLDFCQKLMMIVL